MTEHPETTIHYSVLKEEVIEQLVRCRQGTDAQQRRYLDCTLGGGGHTAAILQEDESSIVVACDRDQRAIDRAQVRFKNEIDSNRLELLHTEFSNVESCLSEDNRNFDGVLVDLGVSTDQIKEGRGFSFRDDESLDMRMDESAKLTAAEIVNTYSERELVRIFKRGGADKEASSAARVIVQQRPFTSTAKLSEAVSTSLEWLQRKKRDRGSSTKNNPATVVLQAIRIEVNQEFEEIDAVLESAPRLVKDGGRLGIITFHSLEDKFVTHKMRAWAQGNTAPAYLGIIDRGSKGKFITRQPILPTEEEIALNPASRSARLRVFEFTS